VSVAGIMTATVLLAAALTALARKLAKWNGT
jgi:hypothetical protein